MKEPNYAPVYAALYPRLAEVLRSHGYALAIQGSMARDFDLVAVPWADDVSRPHDVIDEITKKFTLRLIGEEELKKHGRTVWTLSIGHGRCAIDLSFTPSNGEGC